MHQLLTKKGKKIINSTGLPIYNLPIDLRIRNIKRILTIGMSDSERKWWDIQNHSKHSISFSRY